MQHDQVTGIDYLVRAAALRPGVEIPLLATATASMSAASLGSRVVASQCDLPLLQANVLASIRNGEYLFKRREPGYEIEPDLFRMTR